MHTTISDINDTGASATVVIAYPGQVQIQLIGTWGASDSVALQRSVDDGTTWKTIATYTADAFQTIDNVDTAQYRTNTTDTSGTLALTGIISVTAGSIKN